MLESFSLAVLHLSLRFQHERAVDYVLVQVQRTATERVRTAFQYLRGPTGKKGTNSLSGSVVIAHSERGWI